MSDMSLEDFDLKQYAEVKEDWEDLSSSVNSDENSDIGNYWAEREERQAQGEGNAAKEEWEWDRDNSWLDDAVQNLRW